MCLKRVEKYIRCAIIYHISEFFIGDGFAMNFVFVAIRLLNHQKNSAAKRKFRGGYKRIILLITQVLRSI